MVEMAHIQLFLVDKSNSPFKVPKLSLILICLKYFPSSKLTSQPHLPLVKLFFSYIPIQHLNFKSEKLISFLNQIEGLLSIRRKQRLLFFK